MSVNEQNEPNKMQDISQEAEQSPVPEQQTISTSLERNYDLLADHEKRVVEEKKELGQKIILLSEFIKENPIFPRLDSKEQRMLKKQMLWMDYYYRILEERIDYFFTKSGNIETEYPTITAGEKAIGFFGNENTSVFTLKSIAALFIDETNRLGRDGRRNAVVTTDMEKTQMMAVKSLFS